MGRNSECRTHQGLGKTIYSLICNSSPGDVPLMWKFPVPGHVSPCPLSSCCHHDYEQWLHQLGPRERKVMTQAVPSWLATMCVMWTRNVLEFPSCPVVETPCFHCQQPWFNSWVSEQRPHKLCNAAKKKERKKEMSFYCCEALRLRVVCVAALTPNWSFLREGKVRSYSTGQKSESLGCAEPAHPFCSLRLTGRQARMMAVSSDIMKGAAWADGWNPASQQVQLLPSRRVQPSLPNHVV